MEVVSFGQEALWFLLIQSLGIVGSLCLTAVATFKDAKAKEIENVLRLAELHKNVWAELREKPDLARILDSEADVIASPPSTTEAEFLNSVIVHYQTGWWVSKSGGMTTLKEMEADSRDFFSLPLPNAVWYRTKRIRNPDFVRFVDRALAAKPSEHRK
jgi:hypothetical protein